MGNGILCSLCVVGVCKVHTCSPGQPGVVCCHCAVAAHIPQPAHVVHGVSLHLFPMSWSWTQLLPLSSPRSRCAPHPSFFFFSERTSSEDWCDAYPHTDVSAQSMGPSPCLLHGVDSLAPSHFHTQHSGVLPCTHCLHLCVSICVHGVGRGVRG